MSVKLYAYWRSSCSNRVLIALRYKQIEYEFIPVNLVEGAQSSSEYTHYNHMNQVPTLVHGDFVLTQSVAILQYLDNAFPEHKLTPENPQSRAKMMEVVEIINSGTQPMQNLSLLRELTNLGKDTKEWSQQVILKGLTAVENIIKDTAGQFCIGDQFTLADCCLVPQVYNAQRFELDISGLPTVSRVFDFLKDHEVVVAVHPYNLPGAIPVTNQQFFNMVKQLKKGQKGERAQYITKAEAMKKLQLSAKQFHRLCILKGVYPRDPKKRKNMTKTYYHIKDIKFLSHEQLLAKFRQIESWLKKIRKAKAKGDTLRVEKLAEATPSYSLHHLVKERYPTFTDAIRDLDDALSLICLFAGCPSSKDLRISREMIQLSQTLWNEFDLWLKLSRSLRKSFLSVKGIYYQAEIKGIDINWLVPYQFTQTLPQDVDYQIMLTFLEFYHTMLRFVNFKLYQELGISYPPDLSQPFSYFKQHTNIPQELQIPSQFTSAPEIQKWQQRQQERTQVQQLFAGLVFFLSRETPRYSLELVILSCSGEIVFDDSDIVTHQIVDRPGNYDRPNREFVQPQWIYDCINWSILLPVGPYRPGQAPPPHISPFVDLKDVEHMPERLREILALKGHNVEEEETVVDERKELGKILMSKKIRNLYNRMQFSLRKKRATAERLKRRREELTEE